MKKTGLVLCAVSALLVSSAFSQGTKVIVITETAHIYAEPDSQSYLIETVGKGTVLILFQKNKIRENWYYIAFDSKERKGKVSGFVQGSAVERAHDVQNSSGAQEGPKGDEGQSPILPLLKHESVVQAEETKAISEKGMEELSLTALSRKESHSLTQALRGEKWPIVASLTWRCVAFQEIAEPAVKIRPRKMENINASPMNDCRAFQSIIKPPEETRAVTPSPPLSTPTNEAVADKGREHAEAPEIMLITPLQKNLKREGSRVPLTESPTKEVVAFQERTEPRVKIEPRQVQPVRSPSALESRIFQPPVEIKAQTLPSIDPPAAMEDTVFQRMPQIDKFKADSSIGVSSSSGEVTSKGRRMEKFREREPEEEAKRQPTPFGAKRIKTKFKWVTLGLGYGQSLGGVGGFIQINTKAGLSFHGGVGYYPTTYIYSGCDWVKDVTLFTVGIKYYLPLSVNPLHFYINLQFGGIGVEAARIIKGIWQYDFIFDYKQRTLWGPAFLGGLELRMGSLGLNGALGFSYNTTKLDWVIQDYFLTFDLGLLLYF